MNAALFWFYKGNEITDEAAFEALQEGDIKTAQDIWTKLTENTEEVTKKNASAFHNLATLFLNSCIGMSEFRMHSSPIESSFSYDYEEDRVRNKLEHDYFENFDNTTTYFRSLVKDEKILKKCVLLKLKFLESDYIQDFKELITDTTFRTTKKDLQLIFLNQIIFEIEKEDEFHTWATIEYKSDKITVEFIGYIKNLSFTAKEEFLNNFIQKQIEKIEKRIKNTKTQRVDKTKSAKVGKELYIAVKNKLGTLKNILGENNLKYSNIADKVANEILQCGIEYFNHYQETDTDPTKVTMDLFEKAKSLTVGGLVKERVEENVAGLEKYKYQETNHVIAILQLTKDVPNNLFHESLAEKTSDMIEKIITAELTKEKIKKIAISENETLINEFHSLLSFHIHRYDKYTSSLMNKLTDIEADFYNSLPDGSNIKKSIFDKIEARTKKVNGACSFVVIAFIIDIIITVILCICIHPALFWAGIIALLLIFWLQKKIYKL